jgi:hypothetical protein
MGDYTRQTENYARRDRTQTAQKNTQKNAQKNTQQSQPVSTSIIYTCWKCNKNFDLPAHAKPDTVRCPYCNMPHGLITLK